MSTQESKQVNDQSELLKALAAHAITFPSDEEANAAGFYMNDGSLTGRINEGVVLQYLDAFTKQYVMAPRARNGAIETVPFNRHRLKHPIADPDKEGKTIKYLGPTGCSPHAFFPCITDWAATAHDVSTALILLEGEYKAFSATQNLGIPTIGLGGVNSYKTKRDFDDSPLLADLMRIKWANRTVYICFDSDVATNENVRLAQQRLAEVLYMQLKANVLIVTLPNSATGEKQGLDDFIVNSGADAVKDYINNNAQIPKTFSALLAFRKLCARVSGGNNYIDLRTGLVMPKRDALDHFAREKATVLVTRNGKQVLTQQPLLPLYITWPGLLEVASTSFFPGAPTIFEDPDTSELMYNTYKPMTIQPVGGDWSVIKNHINHVLCSGVEEQYEFFMDWLAWLFQKPSDKTGVVMCLTATDHGTGKSTIVEQFIAPMLGMQNVTKLTAGKERGFNSRFLGPYANKTLVYSNELKWAKSSDVFNTLQDWATSELMELESKNKDSKTYRTFTNFFLTSNEPEHMHLGAGDRRFFCPTVSPRYSTELNAPDRVEYFNALWAACKSQSVREAALAELLARPLDDKPRLGDRIPSTEVKARMTGSYTGVKAALFDYFYTGRCEHLIPRSGGFKGTYIMAASDTMRDDVVKLTSRGQAYTQSTAKMARELRSVLEPLGFEHYKNNAPKGWVIPSLQECRELWLAAHPYDSFEDSSLDAWIQDSEHPKY